MPAFRKNLQRAFDITSSAARKIISDQIYANRRKPPQRGGRAKGGRREPPKRSQDVLAGESHLDPLWAAFAMAPKRSPEFLIGWRQRWLDAHPGAAMGDARRALHEQFILWDLGYTLDDPPPGGLASWLPAHLLRAPACRELLEGWHRAHQPPAQMNEAYVGEMFEFLSELAKPVARLMRDGTTCPPRAEKTRGRVVPGLRVILQEVAQVYLPARDALFSIRDAAQRRATIQRDLKMQQEAFMARNKGATPEETERLCREDDQGARFVSAETQKRAYKRTRKWV